MQAGDGNARCSLRETSNPIGLNSGEVYRRLLERMRTSLSPHDMSVTATRNQTLVLPGKVETLALLRKRLQAGLHARADFAGLPARTVRRCCRPPCKCSR